MNFRHELLDGSGGVSCWLADTIESGPCLGGLQRAHLIPQQTMKGFLGPLSVPCPVFRCKAGPRTRCVDVRTAKVLKKLHSDRVSVWNTILWDPRCWRWMCERHHHELDFARTVRIPRELLPGETEEFAAQYGLGWFLDREYGPLEQVA